MKLLFQTLIFAILSLAFAAMPAAADINIVKQITLGGRNQIIQPHALASLLNKQEATVEEVESPSMGESSAAGRRSGYRVQVFLDNNPSTAKSTARSRANAIGSRFPELRTYVTYNSPYWRLRVGDFKTQAEAAATAEELKVAFPRTAKEIRVVRDNINLAD